MMAFLTSTSLLLEGLATRFVQGFNLTNANYNSAVELLTDWFGKPQQIISTLMGELFKIPSCVKDKLHLLRTVYDEIVFIREVWLHWVFRQRNTAASSVPMIMSKLPPEIQIQIARKTCPHVWNIEELMAISKTELESREAGEAIKTNESFTQTDDAFE